MKRIKFWFISLKADFKGICRFQIWKLSLRYLKLTSNAIKMLQSWPNTMKKGGKYAWQYFKYSCNVKKKCCYIRNYWCKIQIECSRQQKKKIWIMHGKTFYEPIIFYLLFSWPLTQTLWGQGRGGRPWCGSPMTPCLMRSSPSRWRRVTFLTSRWWCRWWTQTSWVRTISSERLSWRWTPSTSGNHHFTPPGIPSTWR